LCVPETKPSYMPIRKPICVPFVSNIPLSTISFIGTALGHGRPARRNAINVVRSKAFWPYPFPPNILQQSKDQRETQFMVPFDILRSFTNARHLVRRSCPEKGCKRGWYPPGLSLLAKEWHSNNTLLKHNLIMDKLRVTPLSYVHITYHNYH
jgi:hypothetical protein